MAETRFYLCDVCATEISDDEPCHRAIEVMTPGGFLSAGYRPSDDLSNGRLDRYVCANCLPLRRYKTRRDRLRAGRNLGDMRISELVRWICQGGGGTRGG